MHENKNIKCKRKLKCMKKGMKVDAGGCRK
jgi:hypothetical protein